MNKNHSQPYLERWITPQVRDAVTEHPVVVVTGARQVGKSTLLRHAEPFRAWRYRTMDDADTLAQAEERPEALWAGERRVVLDEVQKTPGVLPAVKQAVDVDRSLRFVLSGSANLLLMRQVSETLAGRAVYFVLEPMALGEIHGTGAGTLLADALAGRWPEEAEVAASEDDPVPWLLRGLWPALLPLGGAQAVLRWWEGYVATYLERDLRQLTEVASLVDFRRLMELLALRSGQMLNQSELGRDAGLSQPTVHRYLNLLETTHLIQRVPALAPGRTARLIKTPRPYWLDPALAVFLSGYFDLDGLRASRELGFFFETFALLHLRVLAGLMVPRARIYTWRTRRGDEVDFVVEHGRRLLGVEVKLSSNVGFRQTSGLRRFLDDHPHAAGGLVVYGGSRVRRLDERIHAVPWQLLTG